MPIGGCSLCAPTDAGTKPGNLVIKFISAGTLTLKDGSNPLATLPFDADAGGFYQISSVTAPSLACSPGDTLAATASGSTFPAFSGSITAPQDFAGVSPALSLVTLSRSPRMGSRSRGPRRRTTTPAIS